MCKQKNCIKMSPVSKGASCYCDLGHVVTPEQFAPNYKCAVVYIDSLVL